MNLYWRELEFANYLPPKAQKNPVAVPVHMPSLTKD